MNIESIHEYIVFGKTLNFTNAAKNLYIDQSTLSRHLMALEKEIGTKLVDRTSSNIKLTEVGKVLLEEMIEVVDLYDKAMTNVKRCAERQAPVVVLGGALIEPGISKCAVSAISLAAKNHMPVTVTLFDAHSSAPLTRIAANDPIKCVKDGKIDMVIVFGCEGGDWTGLERKTLFRERFVAFVSTDHPLLQKKSVKLADFYDWTIVTITLFDTHNTRIVEACNKAGFEPKTRARVGESVGEILVSRLTEEIFLFSKSTTELVAPTPISGLVQLEIDDPLAYFEVQAIWREDNTNYGIPVYIEALEEVCELLGYSD